MATNLHLPQIGGTDREQIAQIRRYLYLLINDLQMAFDALEKGGEATESMAVPASIGIPTGMSALNTFNGIKTLIIQSKEIQKAYTDKLAETYLLTPKNSAPGDTVREIGTIGSWRFRRWNSGCTELCGTVDVILEAESQDHGLPIPFLLTEAVMIGCASDGVTVSPLRLRQQTVTVRTQASTELIGSTVRLHLMISGMETTKQGGNNHVEN